MTTGTTRRPLGGVTTQQALPQWSPVVTTGTTGVVEVVADHLDGAAMEPRRDDGDDFVIRTRTPPDSRAAMEPRRDDGDDSRTSTQLGTTRTRRNGAPS